MAWHGMALRCLSSCMMRNSGEEAVDGVVFVKTDVEHLSRQRITEPESHGRKLGAVDCCVFCAGGAVLDEQCFGMLRRAVPPARCAPFRSRNTEMVHSTLQRR